VGAVKEKRKGPIERAAGLAEGVAATVRRMQREREPRILVYDETGYARLVQPNGRGYERLQETAERMVALVEQAEAEGKGRRARATDDDGAGAAQSRSARPTGSAGAAKKKPSRSPRDGDAARKSGRSARAGQAAKKPRRSASAGAPKRSRRSAREGDG
jgi:hypothetical protein